MTRVDAGFGAGRRMVHLDPVPHELGVARARAPRLAFGRGALSRRLRRVDADGHGVHAADPAQEVVRRAPVPGARLIPARHLGLAAHPQGDRDAGAVGDRAGGHVDADDDG